MEGICHRLLICRNEVIAPHHFIIFKPRRGACDIEGSVNRAAVYGSVWGK